MEFNKLNKVSELKVPLPPQVIFKTAKFNWIFYFLHVLEILGIVFLVMKSTGYL